MSRQIVKDRKTYSQDQQSPFLAVLKLIVIITTEPTTSAKTCRHRTRLATPDPPKPAKTHWHPLTLANTQHHPSTPANTGKYPLMDSWRGAVNLLRCNMKAFYPFGQIRNMEFLQFRVKSEVTDDLRFFCMWLNSLSMYTGNLNISYH